MADKGWELPVLSKDAGEVFPYNDGGFFTRYSDNVDTFFTRIVKKF